MSNILLIILSVTLGSLGQVILKLGANKLGEISIIKIHTFIFEILKIPEILIGLVLFGTSFLLWIKVLTKSDRIVLKHLMQGLSNKEIAKALGRSVRTVEDHRSHIMHKLGTDNIVDLTQKVLNLPNFCDENPSQ